jgi:hypothetical protein
METVPKDMMAMAFEEAGDQWLYYANAWSKGVLVSAQERDLYLDFKLIAFRRSVAGREPSAPPRPYWPTVKRLLKAVFRRRET